MFCHCSNTPGWVYQTGSKTNGPFDVTLFRCQFFWTQFFGYHKCRNEMSEFPQNFHSNGRGKMEKFVDSPLRVLVGGYGRRLSHFEIIFCAINTERHLVAKWRNHVDSTDTIEWFLVHSNSPSLCSVCVCVRAAEMSMPCHPIDSNMKSNEWLCACVSLQCLLQKHNTFQFQAYAYSTHAWILYASSSRGMLLVFTIQFNTVGMWA